MIRLHPYQLVYCRTICFVDILSSVYIHELNRTHFRCTRPASTVSCFLRFYVALGINSGGMFNTQQTGLRLLSRVFLAGNYTTRSILQHDFIYITDVHVADLTMLLHSYFDF